MKIHPVGAESF